MVAVESTSGNCPPPVILFVHILYARIRVKSFATAADRNIVSFPSYVYDEPVVNVSPCGLI